MFIFDSKIHDDIQKFYHQDNFFKSIIENSKQYPLYTIRENDLIYLHDDHFYIFNSKSTRELLLHQYHDNKNHFDVEKIYQILSRKYF